MTPAVADALVRHGHKAHALSELDPPADAGPGALLELAEQHQWDVLTTDSALASAPFEQHVPFSRSVVYLQLEGADVEQDDAIDRLFERYKRLSPRRLYTVTGTRVKIRQLPGAS
jgi:hypothetical protein